MIHSRTKILTLALSKQGPHVHLYVLLRGRPPAIVRAYYSGNTCPSGQASNAHKDKKMDAVPDPARRAATTEASLVPAPWHGWSPPKAHRQLSRFRSLP